MMRMSLLAMPLVLLLPWAGAAIAAPAGEAVVGQHLADGVGYVSAVRLAHQPHARDNGRMLLVFEPSAGGGIPLYQSDDDGDHWQPAGEIRDQPHHDPVHWQLRWQPNLGELPRGSGDLRAGTLLLAANAIDRDDHGHLVQQDLQLYASNNAGRSWQYRSSIVVGGGQPSDRRNQGVWEPYIVALDDGRLVAYYSSEQHKERGFNQLLAHKVSTDGGRSWGAETFDVAQPGGVERPGMANVARIADRGYAMVYENIDGERNGQVHLKFSVDGLDWGDPADRGIEVRTASGTYPAACPTLRWMPGETAAGVLLVAAQRAADGADPGGRTLYWNDDGGRGPWWQVPAPVQKRTDNIHAGWTQAMLVRGDGELLHVTSSSTDAAPEREEANEILHAHAPLRFDRYEAEDAVRRRGAAIGDALASSHGKVRLAAGEGADLSFEVHVAKAGPRRLRVRFADLGFPASPEVRVNGRVVEGGAKPEVADGWRISEIDAPLQAGTNVIVIANPERALDYDYLEILPVAR